MMLTSVLSIVGLLNTEWTSMVYTVNVYSTELTKNHKCYTANSKELLMHA